MNSPPRILPIGCLAAGVALVCSCSGIGGPDTDGGADAVKSRKRDKQVIALGEAEGFKALQERFAFDARSLKKDKKGNFTGPVRSQYDQKRNVSFGGGVGKAVYRVDDYRSPGQRVSRKLTAESYREGNLRSRFQQKPGVQITSPAHLASKSRFQGQRMKTGSLPAAGAREGAAAPLDKPANRHTEFRREVFPEPLIISDDEYNRRSVEQMRDLLGRDE